MFKFRMDIGKHCVISSFLTNNYKEKNTKLFGNTLLKKLNNKKKKEYMEIPSMEINVFILGFYKQGCVKATCTRKLAFQW